MISLLLDTSSSHLLVSITRNEEVLALSKLEDCIGHSTKLMVEIDACLERTGISLCEIDTIFVVNGPGSFTGLRVGVTNAKILAYTLQKKIVPISSLELMATTTFEGDYIIPFIDARRGYVYAGIYDKELTPYLEDSYIKVEDLLKKVPRGASVSFVGYTAVDKIESRNIPMVNVLAMIDKHRFDVGVSPHQVNPNYLKKTEAEENRKND